MTLGATLRIFLPLLFEAGDYSALAFLGITTLLVRWAFKRDVDV